MENRRWGWYDILLNDKKYKVKRLCVKPGECISLQYHHHRSEHWTVVEGSADVVLGTESVFVSEGESVFIPTTMQHKLINNGKIDLVIIETQIGNYLEEDDIVRLDLKDEQAT